MIKQDNFGHSNCSTTYVTNHVLTTFFSPLIASADSCSLFFLSIYLPFFQLHVISCDLSSYGHQQASVGMCMCAWVCICVRGGVRGCALVCVGVCGCAWVCASMRRCAWVCAGMRECALVCVGMRKCERVCAGVCEYGRVCVGMNFQNFFWRIESLHQRTLIRILYEFFK